MCYLLLLELVKDANEKMKRELIILLIIFTGLVIAGCGSGASKVALGEEFSLKIGESAVISGEDLEIMFLEVLEDSRCPKNVECVWAGRARSLVEVKTNDSTENVELTDPGLTDPPNQLTYHEYQIMFYLLPYPEDPDDIISGEYRLRLTISKAK